MKRTGRYNDDVPALEVENERLRAALKEIAKVHWTDKDGRKFATHEAEIARLALED